MKNWLIACGLVCVLGCGGNTGNGDGAGGSAGTGTGGTGVGGSGVGGSGVGGSSAGGSGGNIPSTGTANKVDLLVMVDNSISMADKQLVLAEALPGLLNAFTTPPNDGSGPAYAPVTDIHFGVITSSLGGHGGDVCSPSGSAQFNETQNDKAHLVGSVRPGLPSHNGQGFLWWDPNQQSGGESDPGVLVANFQQHVQAAGEQGCGYEASLESWYRFLIDPDPPESVTQENGVTVLNGIDNALLQQRADFLRPDSLVIIVVLSDENDCSMMDSGQNWIFAQVAGGGGAFHLPAATSTCATDPNSVCCRSCAEQEGTPPAGCGPISSDPVCTQSSTLDDQTDHINLRCWNQMQRFGISGLHPTRRYVDGLTKSTVPDRSGNLVPNPLFAASGTITRAQNMVMFVPIVGVPWQDLATADSLTSSGLTYLSAEELVSQGRWSWMVPNCKSNGADGVCDEWDLKDQPDDPLMIESTQPRTGVNPATGSALAPPTSGPGANPINGHESVETAGQLQYACIFDLAETRDCTQVGPGTGCDCQLNPDPASIKNPLCQASDGTYSTMQYRAKAYPGTRQLQVAKDLGSNAVVGSACPKTGGASGAHAYIPVVDAVARQLGGRLAK